MVPSELYSGLPLSILWAVPNVHQTQITIVAMKAPYLCLAAAFAFALTTRAEDFTAKITGVHLCCKGCVNGVEKAVQSVKGASAAVDPDADTVTITAPDKQTGQAAANALAKAGYWGKSEVRTDKQPLLRMVSGASGKKVQTLKVAGVHLCCDKCVHAVNNALKDVPGVKANTAAKHVDNFEVSGDFKDSDVFAALHKAGLSGHVAE